MGGIKRIFGTSLVAVLVVAVSAATADTGTAAAGSWTDWDYSKSVVVKENSGDIY